MAYTVMAYIVKAAMCLSTLARIVQLNSYGPQSSGLYIHGLGLYSQSRDVPFDAGHDHLPI